MDMLEFMLKLHEVCKFQTREGKLVGTASKSEIRRWFQRNAVHVNGRPAKAEDSTPETWISLVLFPKSHPVTLW